MTTAGDGRSVLATPRRIGPTFTAVAFLRATFSLARRGRELWAIWVRRRVEPSFREELMVAVARANSCRFCSYHHREWALHTGLPPEELAALEGVAADLFDPRRWAAIAYVQALAQSGFESVPLPIEAHFQSLYEDRERRDIEAIARAMTWANRVGNTVDSLLARRRGEPLPDNRAPDDYLVGGLGIVVAIPAALTLALWRRGSPMSVLRDFKSFSNDFAEQIRI